MQCNNEGILLVFADLRGNEQGVRKLLVGVLERIGPLLNPRIDTTAQTSAASALLSVGSAALACCCRSRLLLGLMCKLNLSGGNVQAKRQSSDQSPSQNTSRHDAPFS